MHKKGGKEGRKRERKRKLKTNQVGIYRFVKKIKHKVYKLTKIKLETEIIFK